MVIHNTIEVSNSSAIKITDCKWHGMTVNPMDVKIEGHCKMLTDAR